MTYKPLTSAAEVAALGFTPLSSASSLNAANLTGALPALNGAALTGVTASLPTASSTVLGGIKVGAGLVIDGSGNLSAVAQGSTATTVGPGTGGGTTNTTSATGAIETTIAYSKVANFLSALSNPVASPGYAVGASNVLYYAGGVIPTGSATSALWAVDLTNIPGSTLSKASMPTAIAANMCYMSSVNLIDMVGQSLHYQYTPGSNTWATAAAPPVASVTSCGVGTKIYLFGTANVFTYTYPANTWSGAGTAIPGPLASSSYAAIAIGTLIYLIGNGANTYVYDTVGATFTSKLGWTGGVPSLATDGTNIYAFSNTGNQMYSPSGNTWTALPPCTFPRSGAAAGYYAGTSNNVYLMNGTTSSSPTLNAQGVPSAVESYGTSSGVWNAFGAVVNMPAARANGAVVNVNNIFYLIGGTAAKDTVTGSVLAYDPSTGAYTVKTSMTTARQGFGYAVVGTKIYCFGGSTSTQTGGSAANVATADVYDTVANTWTTLTSMTTARNGLVCGVNGTNIYCIGGQNTSNTAVGTNEMYDTVGGGWTTKTANTFSAMFSGTAIDSTTGKIYVIGGESGAGAAVSTCTVYTPGSDTWASINSLPSVRTRFMCTYDTGLQNYSAAPGIGVFGGTDMSTNFLDYTSYIIATNTWAAFNTALNQAGVLNGSQNVPARNFGKIIKYGALYYMFGGSFSAGPTFAVASSSVETAMVILPTYQAPATGHVMRYDAASFTNQTATKTGSILAFKANDWVQVVSNPQSFAAFSRSEDWILS